MRHPSRAHASPPGCRTGQYARRDGTSARRRAGIRRPRWTGPGPARLRRTRRRARCPEGRARRGRWRYERDGAARAPGARPRPNRPQQGGWRRSRGAGPRPRHRGWLETGGGRCAAPHPDVERFRAVEIADVRSDERVAVLDDAERVLQVGAQGEHAASPAGPRTGNGQNPRARRITRCCRPTTRTTESS